MTETTICIVEGHAQDLVGRVRELFREYAVWLAVDLCFQDFDAELALLPGKYAPPQGALLLAYVNDNLAGCVAMRPLEDTCCEIKRLWVREAFRDLGLGKSLVNAILDRACGAGYLAARLDTLSHMRSALALYRKQGFREIPAYYVSPLADTVYLEKRLVAG